MTPLNPMTFHHDYSELWFYHVDGLQSPAHSEHTESQCSLPGHTPLIGRPPHPSRGTGGPGWGAGRTGFDWLGPGATQKGTGRGTAAPDREWVNRGVLTNAVSSVVLTEISQKGCPVEFV